MSAIKVFVPERGLPWRRLGRGLSCVLAGALAWPAHAGGVSGLSFRHQRCLQGTECVVRVLVGVKATPGNSCGVNLPDVVVLGRQVTKLTWTLAPLPGAAKHRFEAAARVRINDNSDTANEPELQTGGTANFNDEALPADAGRDSKQLGANAHLRMKVHSYTVTLERETAPGSWAPCDPYDPIVITRGG
jgi:hypothetical protein